MLLIILKKIKWINNSSFCFFSLKYNLVSKINLLYNNKYSIKDRVLWNLLIKRY